MTDLIVGIVVAVIIGAALLYIRREKKKGAACIGCPNACTCQKHADQKCHTEE
nr:FeoB-associated Cys-rich membrane protein [uncultured Anaerotignum sp.]